MILRSVELIDDFVHHIDSFDFAGKELDIYFFTGGFGAFCRRGAFSWVESALLDAVLLAAPPQPANVPPSIATAIVIAANLRSFIVFFLPYVI